MISLPPAACCTKLTKHEGTTTGTIEKIGDSKSWPAALTTPHLFSCHFSSTHSMVPTQAEPIPTVDAYFARPADNSTEKAIIIFGDIFGIYQNIKLVADSFAARGFLAVVPDMLEGDSLSTEDYDNKNVDIPGWLQRHLPDAVDPIVEKVIAHLRETLKVKKIAGVGYCYGARVCTALR